MSYCSSAMHRISCGRPTAAHLHTKESRGFERERVRKPRLRFCIVSSIASAKETHNGTRKRTVFSFRQLARCNNRSEKTHVTGTNVKSRGFKSSLNGTKWPRVQPKLARAALHGFFFSLPRAYTGVRSHNGTLKTGPNSGFSCSLRVWIYLVGS